MPEAIAAGARRYLRRHLRRLLGPAWISLFRRTTPLSDSWGFDRGTPVDRYYIEGFLGEHRRDIHGRVLELRDSTYTARFGAGVERTDVLDIDGTNPRATIVADLSAATEIDADRFDCFILTQTLQFIYDTRGALAHAHRILRPGGVLLVTVPSVSRIAPRYGLETDYWRLTGASCARLFGDVFGAENVHVHSYGNVLTAVAFLSGIASEEIPRAKLRTHDPYFPVIIAVRATKPVSGRVELRT
jgi:SAM-dependent methyltransferase